MRTLTDMRDSHTNSATITGVSMARECVWCVGLAGTWAVAVALVGRVGLVVVLVAVKGVGKRHGILSSREGREPQT